MLGDELTGKIIIVTGASRGIGREIAVNCCWHKATTIVNYKSNREAADDVMKQIGRGPGVGKLYQADVSNVEEANKMIDDVFNEFGKIDVLINNAGIVKDKLLLAMEPEDWYDVINTNLGGMFNCTKAVAKYMVMQKSGKIINISSVSGEKPGRGQSNYAASKGGVNSFTRAIAMELAPKGITVNAVAPGVIETDMSETVVRRGKDKIMDMVALKRLGTPEDVANVVGFLVTDEADYITGEIIHVDGGFKN